MSLALFEVVLGFGHQLDTTANTFSQEVKRRERDRRRGREESERL